MILVIVPVIEYVAISIAGSKTYFDREMTAFRIQCYELVGKVHR